MPLAEGVSQRIIYKPYATGVITANTEPVATVDPGVTGGKTLRRVSSTLELAKNTYSSNEIRADRQIADFRHGTRHAQGKIAGELSPSSYFDLFEATHRDTRVGPVALTHTQYTSIAASASASTLTLGSGDAVALGLTAGDIIRLSGSGTTANNGVNFTIVSIGGAGNTVLTVSPPPADMSSDTAVGITRPGYSTIVPATGQVSRKFAFEIYGSDIDVSRLFTECRLSGYTLALPATGLSTCDFDVMGRDMQVLTADAAPFFAAPAAASTTGVCASVNGILVLGGIAQCVVTGVNLAMTLTPTAADVVGQNFPAEIFLGRANCTGTLTAYFQDGVIVSDFLNESEVGLMVTLDASSAAGADAISLYMPRIKLSSASVAITGEAGQILTAPFQALLYNGSAPGVPATTIRIVDTAAAAT